MNAEKESLDVWDVEEFVKAAFCRWLVSKIQQFQSSLREIISGLTLRL